MQRFGSPLPSTELQPRPGQRESRSPILRDRTMHRPREVIRRD